MTQPLVFITGASSGIGQALAPALHQAGYRLALAARRTSEVKSWADAHQISASSYEIYSADVAVDGQHRGSRRRMHRAPGPARCGDCQRRHQRGMDTAVREDLDVMARTFATNNLGLAATFTPSLKA